MGKTFPGRLAFFGRIWVFVWAWEAFLCVGLSRGGCDLCGTCAGLVRSLSGEFAACLGSSGCCLGVCSVAPIGVGGQIVFKCFFACIFIAQGIYPGFNFCIPFNAVKVFADNYWRCGGVVKVGSQVFFPDFFFKVVMERADCHV